MNRLLLMVSLLAAGVTAHAQNKNIKTDVLVVGQGNAAVAAALQAAISNVNTTLLTREREFTISSGSSNPTGVEAKFLQRVRDAKNIKDSTARVTFDNPLANSVLSVWADSLKKLDIIKNTGWSKFQRSGSGWLVKLDDGRSIKASVLVYATQGDLSADIKYSRSMSGTALDYENNLYRTSIAGGSMNGKPSVISLYDLIKAGEENLVVANSDETSLALGQAAGATAAYAAFFKTKTSLSNLKVIQGELLNYKLNLVPFADVSIMDTNWRAIQNVGLSGILKPEIKNGSAFFMPDQAVKYEEIKQPVKDFYYKAQIWFEDNPGVPITLENTISLISYVGNKAPVAARAEIEKKWKTSYGFQSACDPKKVLNRREFAVILNEYLKPFDVNFDKTGRVVR